MSRLDLSGLFKRNIRSVSLFGLGRSARALLPYLLHSGYRVRIRSDVDIDKSTLPQGIRCFVGDNALSSVDEDVMILSPSVRRDRFTADVIGKGVILTSDAELFFKSFRGKSFAISGSDGKSTSSTMLYEILSAGGSAHLIGNIGVPMTPTLLSENVERAVCEISSFSLQYDDVHPYRATVTNVKRNHLNWHKDFQEYTEAKVRLLSSALGFSVNLDDAITHPLSRLSSCYAVYSLKHGYRDLLREHGDKVIFSTSDEGILRNGSLIIPKKLISGYTEYNIYNLLSALSLADGEYDESSLCSAIAAHKALPHRCESFLTARGIRFIDSSIDTSPDRTSATLSALSGSLILLLGGKSKGESYSSLLHEIDGKCKAVFVFGEAREKIKSELCGTAVPILLYDSMCDAALAALSGAMPGDTLLLSPASTSFDEFSSFEERGNKFKAIIKDAIGQENTGDKNEKVI